MKIADFIKQKVVEEGTQTAVSRRTGVSQGTITKILSGDTSPELATMLKIANSYGVPIYTFDEVGYYSNKELDIRGYENLTVSDVTVTELTPDPARMNLEQKLTWLGFKTKDIRQIQEWSKLTEEEQDEELKRLCMHNIEKGRY